MRVIAHRGCPDRGPENTVAAVRRAAPHVDAVEVDVRRCATGEVVVFHDTTLGRLLSHPDGRPARGRLDATDWTDLSALRVGDSDEPVPRFADLVEAVADLGLGLNVELKETGLAADVAATLDGFDGDVIVSSFDAAALREMRDVADYPVAPLVDSRPFGLDLGAWDRALAVAADLDAAAVHPAAGLLSSAADPAARVETAHDAGLAVDVWTVTRSASASTLRAAGVDGLIVDDWAVVA